MKKTLELISCEDYVLEEVKDYQRKDTLQGMADVIAEGAVMDRVSKYARLLKQPLTLGMFVPCDLEGNVLSEPQLHTNQIGFDTWEEDYNPDDIKQYKQAKDRVVFEGFEVDYLDGFAVGVKNGNLLIRFWFDGHISINTVEFNEPEVKSISDLCGLGLKYYGQ